MCNMYWFQQTLKTQTFSFIPVKGHSFTRLFDPVKRSHHQTQAYAPSLSQLMEKICQKPDHLPSQSPPNLYQTSDYWCLLSDGALFDYWRQQWLEFAFQQVFKFGPAKLQALHFLVLCFPVFVLDTT